MIIIGNKSSATSSTQNPWKSLTKPFHLGAWAIFIGIGFLFVMVCFLIAVRFHWYRGRSLITAFLIFAGEGDSALAHEAQLRPTSEQASKSYTAKYGLSMALFRMALLALLAIFALFYEVAVVNFLFQQQSLELTKPVKRLSLKQLQGFAVLGDSALELVWNATGKYSTEHHLLL